MRRLAYATPLLVPLFVHCNTIVGVEDVHLQPPKSSTAGSTQKNNGDDDDTTGNPNPVDSTPPTPTPTTPVTPACNGNAACTRIAFVTKATFTGKLGGVSGADDDCNNAAKVVQALTGHVFKAWLSDPADAATSRLPHGTMNYQLTNKAQSVIATSFTDLTDGTLGSAINYDETGALLQAGETTWTGTADDGEADPDYNCLNWTSDDINQTGVFGDPSKVDFNWTNSGTAACNAPFHLYCVEF